MRLRCWLPLLPLLAACGSQSSAEPQNVELFTWWVNPGEQTALDALIDRFRVDRPDITFTRTTASNASSARTQVGSRVFGSDPPDTFQTLGGWDALGWAVNSSGDGSASALEPLNDAVASTNLLSKLPTVVRSSVSYQGQLYAVPLDVWRSNVLFYNKRVFDNNQLIPPTSLAELGTVSEALRAKGIKPLVVGTKDAGNLSQLFFDSVLVASAGSAFRDSYLAGKESATDAHIGAALGELTRVLSYTNDNRDTLEWTSAARLVVDGGAGMTLVGDFAKAFFVSAGLKPGIDFDQVPFPGTRGTFVYLVDAFTLPRGASSRSAALDFLSFLATTSATDAFAPRKGTLPARIDANTASFDALTLATGTDFASNQLTRGHVAAIHNREFLSELDERMRAFASDAEADTVLNWLASRYDQLASVPLSAN
ncbi:MAG: extracellular solute-binding protein [Polyangiaceae bacterium]